MKNPFYIILLGVAFLIFSKVAAQEQDVRLLKKVEGFNHPESVIYDSANQLLYVSNIGETETEDGYISKVSVDGEIIEKQWITGLEDPKGLLLLGDTLYVTDLKDLVIMNSSTGEITDRISVNSATFLNDLTADAEGNIFISDSKRSSIYKRSAATGKIEEWMFTEKLEYPNGLLVVGDQLYIAAWGGEGAGNLLKVDMQTKKIDRISTEGIGNLDGIQQINDEEFFISNWATGKIYRISKTGEQKEILTSEKSSGDILYYKQEDQLVLPMNHQNAVWWYSLSGS